MIEPKKQDSSHSPRFSVKELLQVTGGKLLQGNPDAKVIGVSTDTRSLKPQQLFIAIKGNNLNGHKFIATALRKFCGGLIISEKISRSLPKDLPIIVVKNTTRAFADIARFHRQRFSITLIAVTGSNGKTTAKEMVAAVLQQKFKVLKNEGTLNNHIGVPQTLLKLNPKHQAAVLELGTNHPGEIAYLANIAQPTAAIITNVGPSHLEFLETLYGVFKEKKSLLDTLRKPGLVILNNDDPFLRRIKNEKIITFGINKKSKFMAKDILRGQDRISFTINQQKITLNSPARHNVYNALCAIACGRSLGISYNSIKKALAKFRFPSGRLQIKNLRGAKIIDDTYNANPLSLKCAVDVLAGYNSHRKIIVCADMKELGKESAQLHSSLGRYIGQSSIHTLITFGKLAENISQAAKKAGMDKKNIYHVTTAEKAAHCLLRIIRRQDIVLVKGSRSMVTERVVEALIKN